MKNEPYIKHIAIILHDLDMGITCTEVLKTAKRVVDYRYNTPPDVMDKIIRSMLKSHYMAFQNQYLHKHTEEVWEDHFDSIERYLNRMTIYFNEDAYDRALEPDNLGAGWIIDIEQDQINCF